LGCPRPCVNGISEDVNEKRTKKAAIVILFTLKREAENSKESETEIRKTIEQALVRMTFVTVDNVIIFKE